MWLGAMCKRVSSKVETDCSQEQCKAKIFVLQSSIILEKNEIRVLRTERSLLEHVWSTAQGHK